LKRAFLNLPAGNKIAECELLRAFHASHHDCGRHVSRALKKLRKDQKGEESALRLHHELQAAAYFQRHVEAMDAVNWLLPADQQLVLIDLPRLTSAVPAAVFTVAQSVACAEGLLAYRHSLHHERLHLVQ
jgi:hypothetical protein